MIKTSLRLTGVLVLAVTLTSVTAVAAEPGSQATQRYQVAIGSRLTLEQAAKQSIHADTDLVYNWTLAGKERTLRFDSIHAKIAVDGRPLMDTTMTGSKIVNVANGSAMELPIGKAPEDLKRVLQDSFGAPICTVEIDAEGKEIKRTIIAQPGAQNLVDNGMIANAVLFHPGFPRDRNEWQVDAEISMGDGGYAKGTLTYKKAAAYKSGQVVRVSGTLTNNGFKQPTTPFTLEKVKYVVTGEQTYDSTRATWVSGKLLIDVSYLMKNQQTVIGSTSGTMTANMAIISDAMPLRGANIREPGTR